MTKVEDYNPTDAQKDLMRQAMKVKRINYNPSFDRKNIVWRKRNFKILEEKSEFDPIAVLWSGLTSTQKTAWETAGGYCGLTGYQLFTQDTDYRIRNSISGVATPDIHHQYKVLKIVSSVDNNEWLVGQYHDESVEIAVRNVGQKNAVTWTALNEPTFSEIKIEFNYWCDFEELATFEEFQVDITFYGTKGGVSHSDKHIFPLDMQTDWKAFSETLVVDLDVLDHYHFEIQCIGAVGTILLDNFNFEHAGTNWAYNPFLSLTNWHFYRYYSGVHLLYEDAWQEDGPADFVGIYYPI